MAGIGLRIIIVSLVVWLLYRLIYTWIKPRVSPPPTVGAEVDALGEMVQDPVCGVFLPRHQALRETVAGYEHFFCSEECKRKFFNKH
jgi:YHS domain-containing protein